MFVTSRKTARVLKASGEALEALEADDAGLTGDPCA